MNKQDIIKYINSVFTSNSKQLQKVTLAAFFENIEIFKKSPEVNAVDFFDNFYLPCFKKYTGKTPPNSQKTNYTRSACSSIKGAEPKLGAFNKFGSSPGELSMTWVARDEYFHFDVIEAIKQGISHCSENNKWIGKTAAEQYSDEALKFMESSSECNRGLDFRSQDGEVDGATTVDTVTGDGKRIPYQIKHNKCFLHEIKHYMEEADVYNKIGGGCIIITGGIKPPSDVVEYITNLKKEGKYSKLTFTNVTDFISGSSYICISWLK